MPTEIAPPILIGSKVTRRLKNNMWDYFEVQVPVNSPVYRESNWTLIDLQTISGSCGFALVDGDVRFFTKWSSVGYPSTPDVHVYSNISHLRAQTVLSNLLNDRLALSVVGLSADTDCIYTGSFQIFNVASTLCVHGKYLNGLCVCARYWIGPNCDKFSFALVYNMAISAGTFIIGALAAGLIAGCIFKKRADASNVSTSQGYERYN